MNRLLAAAGILVITGGLFLLTAPISHIPLLDANRRVLAESERQGYCAGEVYWSTRGMGSEAAMTECVAASTIDNEINHRRVQPAFCAGITASGLPMGVDACMGIMEGQKFWPTMTGTLSNSWNRRFPYPGEFLSSNVPNTGGESRTGIRDGFSRGDEATPTTTTTEGED